MCWLVVLCLVLAMISGLFTSCKESAEEAQPSPITVADMIGREVTLEKAPERIVSLAPSNTEILYALGLGDKIVGVTDFCDYPEEAKEKEKVGGFSDANIEKIVALEPDLILITDIHTGEVLPELERLGLTAFTIDPRSLDEVVESIILIGEITGKDDEASQMAARMTERINAVKAKTDNLADEQRPKVFFIIWHEPLMTVGTDTRIHELIETAGGRNIIQDAEGYPMIDLETLIDANPQVIIADSGAGDAAGLLYDYATTEPRLKDVDARINNRVYEIETDLVTLPTPRMIDGLEKFAELIHPEIFK